MRTISAVGSPDDRLLRGHELPKGTGGVYRRLMSARGPISTDATHPRHRALRTTARGRSAPAASGVIRAPAVVRRIKTRRFGMRSAGLAWRGFMQRPSLRTGALLAVAGVTLALGGAPLLVAGADHLDAPALGGLTDPNGSATVFDPHSDNGNRDINDVYVFGNAAHTRTTFAMTTNPAVNLGLQAEKTFGTNVRYIINVDRTGDAIQDLAYVWRFGAANGSGVQSYTLTRYTGANARSLRHGVQIGSGSTGGTGMASGKGATKLFAGVRADPFFFDLTGFIGTLFHIGTDCLSVTSPTCDPTDFFSGLNTNALVLEVPKDSIGTTHIGVLGVTTLWNGSTWQAGHQMGRPAINTVFNTKLVDANSGATKNAFNAVPPSMQRTGDGGQFRKNIVTTLENVNLVLGTTGAPFNCTDWDATNANAIANFLLPDVLTYKVGSTADGTTFNGRGLGDDVIDAELGVTTHGCVTTDGVDDSGHTNLTVFPYLGVPH
jgi:hypothetical protein